jgi:FixJ family two-component response regulator
VPGNAGHEGRRIFTYRLRARHARDHLAIIGISGSYDASLIPRFLKNGANDFLHKPSRARSSSAACRRTSTSWS